MLMSHSRIDESMPAASHPITGTFSELEPLCDGHCNARQIGQRPLDTATLAVAADGL
jgi:hypothetical protein